MKNFKNMNGFPSVNRIIIEMIIEVYTGGMVMKKVFAGILTMGLVFMVGGTTAFAAEPENGRNFVDMNGDGVCDNTSGICIYSDSDGDGVCDVCGTNGLSCLTGNGTAFTDADGDGICDKCSTYHWCGMDAAGGGNFVDADGDGVCDNYAAGQGRGNGSQGGRGRYYADTDGDGVCDNYTSGKCQGRGNGCGSGGRGNGSRGGRGR